MLPPRLALGTIGNPAWGRPIVWGLLKACQQAGWVAQRFSVPAAVHPHDPPRLFSRATEYLDAWSLPAAGCVEWFCSGAVGAHLAVVTGDYSADEAADSASLTSLASLLDLPRIAVIDASRHSPCKLPALDEYDGVLLGCQDSQEALSCEAAIAARWNLPVIGVATLGAWAREIQNLSAATPPDRRTLDGCMHQTTVAVRWSTLWQLAQRRASGMIAERKPAKNLALGSLRIAVAFDEAFQGYFPQSLQALQRAGATLVDFSPLRNDCLPRDVDFVLFGDGLIDPWLPRLAENCCLRQRLQAFVRNGGRVLAEGRGAMYFARTARDTNGRVWPMAGLIPKEAVQTAPGAWRRVEATLPHDCWLGPAGASFRGLAPCGWQWDDAEARSPTTPHEVLIEQGIVAVPCSLPLAARPDALRRIFRPFGAIQVAETTRSAAR